MLSVQIDNKQIEQTLQSQFKTPEKIKEYLYELIVEDLEDKKFVNMIKDNHKKEYISKTDILKTLDSI